MQEALFFLMMLPIQLLLLFGIPYLIWRRLRRGWPTTTPLPIVDDGAGGRSVPLVAAFTGIRSLPWVGVSHNSLNPELTITDEGITFRALRRRSRRFDEIEQIDLRTFGATVILSFAFRGTPFTFDANVGSPVLASSVLALLPQEVARSKPAAALEIS